MGSPADVVEGMLLSDRDILAAMAEARVNIIEPFEWDMLQPASVDVRLSGEFRRFATHRYEAIDPEASQAGLTELVKVDPDQRFVLHPGEFALASTVESITLPPWLAGRLEGKSSLGRLGLLTHSTAGWIDPGFTGQVTLELANVAKLPIKLRPGMRIGQLCLYRTTSPVQRPYGTIGLGSHYQGQQGPTESRGGQNAI